MKKDETINAVQLDLLEFQLLSRDLIDLCIIKRGENRHINISINVEYYNGETFDHKPYSSAYLTIRGYVDGIRFWAQVPYTHEEKYRRKSQLEALKLLEKALENYKQVAVHE